MTMTMMVVICDSCSDDCCCDFSDGCDFAQKESFVAFFATAWLQSLGVVVDSFAPWWSGLKGNWAFSWFKILIWNMHWYCLGELLGRSKMSECHIGAADGSWGVIHHHLDKLQVKSTNSLNLSNPLRPPASSSYWHLSSFCLVIVSAACHDEVSSSYPDMWCILILFWICSEPFKSFKGRQPKWWPRSFTRPL